MVSKACISYRGVLKACSYNVQGCFKSLHTVWEHFKAYIPYRDFKSLFVQRTEGAAQKPVYIQDCYRTYISYREASKACLYKVQEWRKSLHTIQGRFRVCMPHRDFKSLFVQRTEGVAQKPALTCNTYEAGYAEISGESAGGTLFQKVGLNLFALCGLI